MKNFINWVVSLYVQNKKFHSFVIALEFALVGFLSTYSGGVPTSKQGWISLGAGLVGAAWGAVKGWLRNNVVQTPIA